MSNHMTQPLSELLSNIVEDGVVDADEVKQLRERLYADGQIDQEEADFLFEVNNAVTGNANDPSWATLFIDGICDFLLNDDQSPGEVDENEAAWLMKKLMEDDQIDATEKQLLMTLQKKAKAIPSALKNFIASK